MAQHEATITEMQQLAPAIVQVTVAVNSDSFRFRSGQWVNLHFPDGLTRAYTIASAQQRPQAMQLCIRIGHGKGAEALQKLQSGDRVTLDGPHGDFTLPDGDTRGVVLLAGDTGIAPARSIVLSLLAANDARAITVLYEPDQRYILYARDFDPLARSGRIVHESGAIDTLIDRNRKRLADAVVMAAGFEPFLERARKAAADAGVDPAKIIEESFGPQPT